VGSDFLCSKSRLFSGSVLTSLSEDDLKSLNVVKLGDRKRLLKEIAKMTGQKTTSSDSGSHPARSHSTHGDLAASGSDSEQRSDSSNGSYFRPMFY
jgi:hypothetical protein